MFESLVLDSFSFSVILRAKNNAEIPSKVIIQRILRSFKYRIHLPNEILLIQSNPPMIIPENIVAKDQVEALRDRASVLLSDVVFLMINGKEQTRRSIIPIPHNKKDNLINGAISQYTDSIINTLVRGTTNAAKIKNGFNFFPLI